MKYVRWLFLCVCMPLLLSAHSEQVLSRVEQVLEQDPYLELSREELGDIFSAIEGIALSKSKRALFTRKQTGLPCTIERCPTLKGFLVRNFSKKGGRIGHGVHKVISKAILYGQEAKVIAFCDSDATGRPESQVLKKLQGCKGIVPYLGMDPKSRERCYIYLEYYPDRSLRKKLNDKMVFTPEQVVRIARGIVSGLGAMHGKKLLHRDLHEGNILLKKSGDLYEAVLVDFGKTLSEKASRDVIPQIPRTKSPPEVLDRPLKKIDRYKSEVYAVGCILHGLVWGGHVPWIGLYDNRHLSEVSVQKRKSCFKKTQALFAKARKKRLSPILQKAEVERSMYEQFQITIFDMLDYRPEKRPSLGQIEQLLSAMEG